MVVPEDDYEPFDESMVIEFQYQMSINPIDGHTTHPHPRRPSYRSRFSVRVDTRYMANQPDGGARGQNCVVMAVAEFAGLTKV